jgi:hypothetical protein
MMCLSNIIFGFSDWRELFYRNSYENLRLRLYSDSVKRAQIPVGGKSEEVASPRTVARCRS